jgi:peptide deformylase
MTELGIYTIDSKAEEAFLRKKTKPFTFEKGVVKNGEEVIGRKEMNDLILKMRKIMHKAHGIGLSANQIGLPYRMFVAQVPSQQGEAKFYAVLNPEIEKFGKEKVTLEEGCLSVIGTFGEVPRAHEVTIRGFDKAGKALKIKAWGLLARVFQHEIDHLDGKLFLDRAVSLERTPEKR